MNRILWIRSEAFDHGVFNTSVRWTVPKVLEFLGSLRAAMTSMTVTRATWLEVTTARCKPNLTEAEAAAYWHVFSVLQQSITGPNADWLDIRIIGVLLMCQVFSPHRVRTDQFAKSGEMWPGHERASGPVSSPRHSPRGSSPRVAVSAQAPIRGSAALLSFVCQHLGYFVQIACFALTAEPVTVAVEDFDLLGLIMCAGTSMTQPVTRISEAVPELYSKKSMPLKDLRKAVAGCLVWNDQIYALADQSQPAQALPSTAGSVNVCGLNKTTWFQRPPNSGIEFLNITSCTDCVIYVTSRVRFCLISGCHECTIIMSAVSGLCSIQNCEKISVHVAAHCFKMENSIDSSAYLFCHVPPVLTGDTRGIKLAPYNVMYSQLSSVLSRAGMSLDQEYVDVWAHPVCCTLGSPDETLTGRSGCLDEPNNSTYHFVHPVNFQPVIVPETNSRTLASSTTLCLPQVYDDALKVKREEMRALQRMIAEIPDEGKRKRAQQAIQGHFREWLQSTGKSRQLADLTRMSQQ
mmetsp:Transcript_12924/g.36849  ORF Transcript_12924/g.36849 Transcript_12924/m.36849 type:complete len:519 (-) Transcript_12924:100-1656(-)